MEGMNPVKITNFVTILLEKQTKSLGFVTLCCYFDLVLKMDLKTSQSQFCIITKCKILLTYFTKLYIKINNKTLSKKIFNHDIMK